MYGFKSFSERTSIEFKDLITGVVGPNGSGKSNVVDAILWVLGEQSAKTLRGSRMDDIVFKGTEKRKANGFAEVSLILDNSDGELPIDFTEVVVTRRLYRSGESVYQINRADCRLRDIIDLFVDSGVGKYGFSIIGQGKIAEMLSATPEGRRYIFEEAAGIMKYKIRRDESQKRLHLTEENITRIDDILAEINQSLPKLEKEAYKAKQYLELAQKLKDDEIQRFVIEYDKVFGRIDVLEKQIKLFDNDIALHEKSKEELEARKERVLAEVRDIAERIDVLRNKERERIVSIERLKAEINMITAEDERLLSEKKSNEEQKKYYTEDLAQTEEMAGILTQVLTEKSANRNEISAEISVLSSSLEELRSRNAKVLGELAILEEEQKRDTAELNNIEVELSSSITSHQYILEESRRTEDDSEEGSSLIKDMTMRRDMYREEYEGISSKLEECTSELVSLNSSYEGLNNEYTLKTEEYNSLGRRIESLRSRWSALNEMKESLEGFNNSTKAVMQLRGRNLPFSSEIIGTVSDIIRVEAKYETAIEVSLGAAVQNIVVKTDRGAKDIIAFIREKRMGYATFLPLNTVQERRISDNDLRQIRHKGFLGVAGDIVSCDAQYRHVASNLLGRILIADNLDSASEIARATRYVYRVVTLNGDVINAYGSISGGSRARSNISNIFSRTREMDEIEATISSEEKKRDNILNSIRDIKEKRDIALKESEKLRERLHSLDLDSNIAKKNYEYILVEYQKAQQVQMQRRLRSVELKEQLAQVEESQNTNKLRVEELKGVIAEREIRIEEYTGAVSADQESISTKDSLLTEVRVNLTSVEGDIKMAQSKLDDAAARMEKRRSQIAEITRREGEIDKLIAEDRVRIKGLEESLKDAGSVDDNERKMLAELDVEYKRAQQTNESLTSEIMSVDAAVNEIVAKKHEADNELVRGDSNRQSLQSRMWENYQVTISDARNYEYEKTEIEELNRRIREYKSEISKMGQVNALAPQQYEDTRLRFEHMSKERNDLENAKYDIINIITEITQEMRVIFTEEFKKINEYFGDVFKKVFGGGKASLELIGSDDVLEAGIDIIVRLPGSVTQHLSLYSGGEKALVAICLLFALLMCHPASFCVLDEIDTALDDSNVVLLAKFIKEFSVASQFIMITHKKGMMEVCDSLYGVSMPEKGVSSLLSVSFEDSKEYVK